MARGMLFPDGLMVLIVVLVLVHHTCSTAEDSHPCSPSSCGNIPNISYPFRLESDPETCGDQRYSLSCENNQTVLNLYDGRYYVREINYINFTIRVVDPGILNAHDSFVPRYLLDDSNFSSGDPYAVEIPREGSGASQIISKAVVFLNCEKPVNDTWYFDTACLKNGVYSSNSSLSHSNKYTYILSNSYTDDLNDLCQVAQLSLSPWKLPWLDLDERRTNISCIEVRNELLSGFELSWYLVYCARCSRDDRCYVDEAENNVGCAPITGTFFPPELFQKCLRVLVAVINKLVPRRIRDIFGVADLDYISDESGAFNKLFGSMSYFVGPPIALKMVLGTPCVIAFLIYKWRRRHLSMYDVVEEFLQSHNNLMPIRYSYSEVKKMTNSFKDKLGEGGFGTVFKGKLRSGRLVAIKMLGKSKAKGQDFISEVATIGMIHHVNVVQLIGFCVEGSKRALVYEFMSNGSLNTFIFSPEVSTLLSYDKMYDIALGVARGIEYLHKGCDMQILHFNIKPHNILLDENFTSKVSDFGLAKLYPVDDSIVSLTAARGTLGYMAPELFYKNIGGVSYKADVYSFGMLLMEMTG